MTTPESPKRGEWRCTNCGSIADRLDDGTLMDVRFALGYCGSCSLRGKVPLMKATVDEAMANVARRVGSKERADHILGLTTGRYPRHVYVIGCCKLKRTDHLEQEQIDKALETVR